jgi:4'-phosphopantetheinyl transferase
VLGERLGVPAAELRFRRGERGKPELVGEDLAFNLSHSNGLALIGVASAGAIGVDLERVRPPRRTEPLLRRWTAKEAVVKAFGLGLALSPRRLEVEEVNRERGLVSVAAAVEGPLPGGAGPVEVRWLEPAEGFVAALATLP